MAHRANGFQDYKSRTASAVVLVILILSCLQRLRIARAKFVLPVVRSFSQMEGSGLHGEANGMTKEHVEKLKKHDFMRHERMLSAVVDFPLDGNEYYVGLYYTEVELGTPPKNYYVQVDTGSDLLWVNCKPCPKCPRESNLDIPLKLYDSRASSTSKNVSCLSMDCRALSTISLSSCYDRSCYYAFSYGDKSTSMGYLVEDVLTLSTVVDSDMVKNVSTNIVFGCGFNQSGSSLVAPDRALDGILGLGRQILSVVSQLVDSGLVLNEFAHCLQGNTGRGGMFVIGDVLETGLTYTPLLPSGFHYNVFLQKIAVGDKLLDIDPDVFNSDGGTIIDSGTTMGLFVDLAYDAFRDQLLSVVSVPYFTVDDSLCFEYSSRDINVVFPSVTLYFDGDAAMQLKPENYLYRQQMTLSSQWCLGWLPSGSSRLSLTILGDIILKNKLVVYDVRNERLGWKDFDCQSGVKVSNGSGNQEVSPDLMTISSDSQSFPLLNHQVLLLFAVITLASLCILV